MVALVIRYKKDLQSTRTRLRDGSQLYPTPAGVIEAALIGQGKAVLVSHGSGGGYDMGLWLGRLIGGPYRYIAPSRFGYLRSPTPETSEPEEQAAPGKQAAPERQADAYAGLVDALAIDAAAIIGLSGGGPSALQFALRHPARCLGLIMLSAASRSVPPLPRLARSFYPFMLKSDFIPWLMYTLAPQMVYQANGVSPALLRRIRPDLEKMRLLDELFYTTFPSSLRRAGMLNDLQQLTNFPRYPLEHICVPTLVVHAANDPLMPVAMGEYSATSIPNAQFLRLEDGGHFTCLTHREAVLPVIQEFLHRCIG